MCPTFHPFYTTQNIPGFSPPFCSEPEPRFLYLKIPLAQSARQREFAGAGISRRLCPRVLGIEKNSEKKRLPMHFQSPTHCFFSQKISGMLQRRSPNTKHLSPDALRPGGHLPGIPVLCLPSWTGAAADGVPGAVDAGDGEFPAGEGAAGLHTLVSDAVLHYGTAGQGGTQGCFLRLGWGGGGGSGSGLDGHSPPSQHHAYTGPYSPYFQIFQGWWPEGSGSLWTPSSRGQAERVVFPSFLAPNFLAPQKLTAKLLNHQTPRVEVRTPRPQYACVRRPWVMS